MGKGENAGNQHFLFFPQCFLPFPKQISSFCSHLSCCLQALSIWTSLRFCRLVKSSRGKQNQILISMSEVQVTAVPIPPCRSMMSCENLTEVWLIRMNRLIVLSQPISDRLWMNTILFFGCCCSQAPVT